MLLIAVIIALGFLAGVVQGVTGFGVGMIIMTFLPYLTGVTDAVATQGVVTVVLSLMIAWRYRKQVRLGRVLTPTVFYIIASGFAIHVTNDINTRLLTICFGVLLVILSLYFFTLNGKLQIRATWKSMFFCGFVSGLCDGFFGIGGPLMVVYLLAVSDSKEEYIANMQICFLLSDLFNCAMRAYEGILTMDLLILGLIGTVGVYVGVFLAGKIVKRMNDNIFRYVVYAMIGSSGVINILRSL